MKAEGDIQGFISAFGDPNPSVRATAVFVFTGMSDKRATQSLCRLLHDPEIQICRLSARALGHIGDSNTVGALCALLGHNDSDLREIVSTSLKQMKDEGAIQPLCEWIAEGDYNISHAAAKILITLGMSSAVTPLIALLSSPNKWTRCHAIYVLGYLQDSRAFEPLSNLVTDTETVVRAELAQAFRWLNDHRGVAPLCTLLKDSEPRVRGDAVEALNKLLQKDAAELLIPMLNDPENSVLEKVVNILGQRDDLRLPEMPQSPKPDNDEDLVANVKALCDSTTRTRALAALTELPASEVLSVIKETLNSTDSSERWRATSALGTVGQKFGWPETVVLLESSISDERKIVVHGAISSLSTLARSEALQPLVVACASRHIAHLVEVFAETTDPNDLPSLKSLLVLAGPVCVEYLLPLLPKMTDKWQVKYATEILEKFQSSPTQSKVAITGASPKQ